MIFTRTEFRDQTSFLSSICCKKRVIQVNNIFPKSSDADPFHFDTDPDIGDLIPSYIEQLTRCRRKHRCCWVQAELPFPFPKIMVIPAAGRRLKKGHGGQKRRKIPGLYFLKKTSFAGLCILKQYTDLHSIKNCLQCVEDSLLM